MSPAYAVGNVTGMYPGDQVQVFTTADALALASKSIAVTLGGISGVRPATLRVQLDFNANPGTFEVDLQESDDDVDANYQTVASVAATNGAPTYSCYIQYDAPTGKFYRLYLKALGTPIASGAKGTIST